MSSPSPTEDGPLRVVDADPDLQAWLNEAYALAHPQRGTPPRAHHHGAGNPLQAEEVVRAQAQARDMRAHDVYAIMERILGKPVGRGCALPPPGEVLDDPVDLGDPADPLEPDEPPGPVDIAITRNSTFWHRFAHAVSWPH